MSSKDKFHFFVFCDTLYDLTVCEMAACYTQMGFYLSKYERERQTKMIISRTATIRIRKNKEKVSHCTLHVSLGKGQKKKKGEISSLGTRLSNPHGNVEKITTFF